MNNFYDRSFLFQKSIEEKTLENQFDKYSDNSLICKILEKIFINLENLKEEKIYLREFISAFLESNDYDFKKINISKLGNSIKEYLIMSNNRILGIKNEIIEILDKIKTFKNKYISLFQYKNDVKSLNWLEISKEIENIDFDSVFDLYLNFLIDKNFPLHIKVEKIFFTLINWEEINQNINEFKAQHQNIKTKFIFDSEQTNLLLQNLNIYNWNDLSKCSNDFLAFLFGTNIHQLLIDANFYQKYYQEIVDKLNDNNIDINDLKNDNKDIYILSKLRKYKYDETILNKVFEDRNFPQYIHFSELNEIFKNEQFWIFIKEMTILNSSGKYSFNKKYHFFYDKKIFNIQKILESLPEIIKSEDISNFSILEKEIIIDKYKKIGNAYAKIGFSFTDLIEKEIKENFPMGYKIDQLKINDDFIKLEKILFEKYELHLTLKKLNSFWNRKRLILIDRGLYSHYENLEEQQIECIKNMKEEIINFIEKEIDEKSFVFYHTIFKYFLIPFKNSNIHNEYLVKGLVDEIILSKDDRYRFARNKIIKKDFEENVNTNIFKTIEEMKGVFSIRDLLQKFNGKKSYFFTQGFDKIKNKIIKLKKETFISGKWLEIKEESKNDILENLFNLIQNSEFGIVSSQKLFNNFVENYKLSYDKLENYLQDEFSFFSLTNYLFLNQNNYLKDFGFRRPYVWNKNLYDQVNKETLLEAIIKSINKDIIKIDELKFLLEKYEFINYQFYSEKMKNLNYIRINRSEYLKSELFEFNDNEIESNSKIINDFFEFKESFNEKTIGLDEIDYSSFEAHYNFEWNKYSLTSFIQRYLDDFFEVKDDNIIKIEQ
ncbi:hypothetical protein ACJA25_02675 [Mycoplasmopsis hyopharyngis]|uniref:hypothetical protein n=1 Tax=Mycoplasmopsis hyopharyngis TaxID=29558 RepID=UPI0038737E4B